MQPGPIRCPGCPGTLGVQHDDYVLSRHQRREWEVRDGAVRCEDCGAEIRIVAGRPLGGRIPVAR